MLSSRFERALDELRAREDGKSLERLTTRLLQECPVGGAVIPHAYKNDLGRDGTIQYQGRRTLLCVSHTAELSKVLDDIAKGNATGRYDSVLFCTSRPVTQAKIERWRERLAEQGLELEVHEREWYAQECRRPVNVWTALEELRLAPDGLEDLVAWEQADWQADCARDDSDGEPPAPIEAGELVDLTTLRSGRLRNLHDEFPALLDQCERWLASDRVKRGAARLRVLWIAGEPVPHRSKALLASLARAGSLGWLPCDAGRDLELVDRVLARCIADTRPGCSPLVGVDLNADAGVASWTQIADHVAQGRKRLSANRDLHPRLIIGGTADQAAAAAAALGTLADVVTVTTRGLPHVGRSAVVTPSERVCVKGLSLAEQRLYGRDRVDLPLLDAAWASPETRVLSVVAFGGTGKSALVSEWLRRMEAADYRGAERVFAWSFYSQGTRDNLVSADDFVDTALGFLGDGEERGGVGNVTLSAQAKGVELARRVKRRRCLLVLDGLEPLQHPPDRRDVGGRLTDQSIRALLEQLCQGESDGLCVITTRVELADLHAFKAARQGHEGAFRSHDLQNLEPDPAADLLRALIGRDFPYAELLPVVREMGLHALAITLLGNYLRDVHDGDLAGRFDLERLTHSEREGGHARRVMATYARWLEQHGRAAELATLHLIGLFDRPADPGAIDALLTHGDLSALSAPFGGVRGEAWDDAVDALKAMGLLSRTAPGAIGTIDAHPLVREHFRDRLRRADPAVWAHGHAALYDHYRGIAPRQPSDAKSMQPLYAAVTHGCAASLHQRVYDEVLLPRIWRDRRTNFSTRHLGLTGADVVALSNYFRHRRWTELHDLPLADSARILIRTNAGVRLRQLGRLVDARESFGGVVGAIDPERADAEQVEDASYAAAQHCELLVIAGILDGVEESALASGRRAIEYADRGEVAYFGMHARSSLAEVHFMLGDGAAAEALFEQAREIERLRDVRPPFLYSQSLYRWGCFLIEAGRGQELLGGGDEDVGWGTNGDDSSLLSQAIRLLILGAAGRSLVQRAGDAAPERLVEVERLLDEAILGLRAAGYPDYLVRGLLERAHFYAVRGRAEDHELALSDLALAEHEIGIGQMDLLHADVLLRRAACRLGFLRLMSRNERIEAGAGIAADLARSATLVEALRYGRRVPLLHELQAQAASCDLPRRPDRRIGSE